jgi:hypothetical protein
MTAFAIGQRITRFSDGATGVVREIGPKGNVWVVWDSSGLQTVMKPLEIRPA